MKVGIVSQKYPTQINELPDQPFFAILRPKSVTIPGDERSRTHPGHGYPESTEHYWSMEVFMSEDAWIKEIKNLESSEYKQNYKAIKASPAIVHKSVYVNVE